MAFIVDKRGQTGSSNQSDSNKQKFYNRRKAIIQRQAEERMLKRKLDDADKNYSFSDTIEERSFELDRSKNLRPILHDNDSVNKGDEFYIPAKGAGKPGSGAGGEGDDEEFDYEMTSQELVDLFFSDLELPYLDNTKNSPNIITYKLTRAGFSKDGIPARLDIKKTMVQALARRIATKEEGKKPRFIDEDDLRYKHFQLRPHLSTSAHVYFVLDVSASMDEERKKLARLFFMYTSMFLKSKYISISITLVKFHTRATICKEEEFYGDRSTGGTVYMSALETVKEDIEKNHSHNKENIYMFISSDGDIWAEEIKEMASMMTGFFLPILRYVGFYLTVNNTSEIEKWESPRYELANLFTYKNCNKIFSRSPIDAVRYFFRKQS